MLRDLEDETATLGLGLALGELDVEGVEDGRELIGVKLDVDDGTNDGLDAAGEARGGGRVGASSLDCRRWLVTRFSLASLMLRTAPGLGFS